VFIWNNLQNLDVSLAKLIKYHLGLHQNKTCQKQAFQDVYDVFSHSVLLLGFVYQSSHGWVLMLVLLMMMGGNTIINTPH